MTVMIRTARGRRVRQALAAASTALVFGSLTTDPASAAQDIGSDALTPTGGCSADFTSLQAFSAPGTSFAAPARGVITQWRLRTGVDAYQVKLKTFRLVSGSTYSVVGSTDVLAASAGTVNVFASRIAVQPGDVLGLTMVTSGNCAANAPGATARYVPGDVPVGGSATFSDAPGVGIPVAARIEPDADGDGYGDESQDACPSQPTTQGQCVPPSTKVTAGPTQTTKSHVKYKFTSTDPAATFECRLTGKNVRTVQVRTYRSCTSPKHYKHLRPGRYTFFVRATDAVGNVDPTPDKVKLRVRP